ncbi:MAG: HEAT repeat domain-containing protein [Microcoleus sp. SIO2G3]|nr:HEAT repeat domain-containing protein [Microcoleus sp. SIO2G3]
MIDSTPIQSLIQAVEQANSAEGLVESVRALVAANSQEAIATLIAVLGYNNPEAAVIAVEGLIGFGEAAVMPLLTQLDEYNYGARAYSIRALATIGDPRALDVLVTAAATDFAPSVRRAAAKGLGHLQWHQLPPEQVKDAEAIALKTLLDVSQDADWANRYAAIVGLQALAANATGMIERIKNRFEQMLSSEADLAVRSRVLMAQQLMVVCCLLFIISS